MKTFLLLIAMILLLLSAVGGCGDPGKLSGQPASDAAPCLKPGEGFRAGVEIADAYCTYGDESTFFFRFTLNNLKEEDADITYDWTLNDPMADQPWYAGSGSTLISSSGKKEIEIEVEKTRLYDSRYYIMYVCTYQNGEQTGYYRDQKSTYDWNYGVTPPIRREVKPPYKHIWISTLVEKNWSGYTVKVTDILFLPPERTSLLPLDQIYVSFKYPYDIPLSPSLADMLNPDSGTKYDMTFCDADSDGELSAGDHLTMSGKAEGVEITFEYRDDPSFHFYESEDINEEQPDAIRIDSLEYSPGDDNTVELEFGVVSDRPLKRVSPWLIIAGTGGFGQSGASMDEPVKDGDILKYHQVIDYSREMIKGMDVPLYLLLYITDGTNEVLRYVCGLP